MSDDDIVHGRFARLKCSTMQILESMDGRGLLALAGVIAPIMLLITSLLATSYATNYNVFRNSISDLELTPGGYIQVIGLIIDGVLVEAFITGLALNVQRKRDFSLAIGCLAIFGLGLFVLGAFKPNPTSVSGTVHLVTAFSIFGLFPFALFFMLPSLRQDSNWQGIFAYTVIAGLLGLGLDLSRLFMPGILNLFGLYERVLIFNAVVWFEVVAIWLLLLTVRRRKDGGKANNFSSNFCK
jgi:hypothetical membrane protein